MQPEDPNKVINLLKKMMQGKFLSLNEIAKVRAFMEKGEERLKKMARDIQS